MGFDGHSKVSSGGMDKLIERRRGAHAGGHGFVLGWPGSGKTSLVKEQIRFILENSEDTVVVLDTDGSYREFAEVMGGQVIPVEIGTGVHINPLDVDMAYTNPDDNLVVDKFDFIIAMLEEMWGQELTARQKSLVDRCVKKIYAPFCGSVDVVTGGYDYSLLPSLTDLYELLCSVGDEDARLIAETLWPFVNGCCKVFGGKTDVRPDSRLVVFDFMRVSGQLQTVAALAVLEYLCMDFIIGGRKERRPDNRLWVYMDDAYSMLRTESAADYLWTLCKQARAYGCIFTMVTQPAETVFDVESARWMLGSVDYVHLLRLSKVDRMKVGEFWGLSEEETAVIDKAAFWNGLVLMEGKDCCVYEFSKSRTFLNCSSAAGAEARGW